MYCFEALFGRPYELAIGVVAAVLVGRLLHHRVPAAPSLPIAACSLAVAGVLVALLIVSLALCLRVYPSWFVPMAAVWFWVASLTCGVIALGRRLEGRALAVTAVVASGSALLLGTVSFAGLCVSM